MEFDSKPSLFFNIIRQKPEFIPPTKSTCSNTTKSTKLLLSDIDDQDFLRMQPFILQFYENYNHLVKDNDPAKLIKEALGQALIFYYPFAGRLKEGPNRKLFVDCNDEGIMFTKADVDFTFEQLRNAFPLSRSFLQKLIYDDPNFAKGILNSSLLYIQVIRLKCGGFIMSIRFNHTIVDGSGLMQFISAVAEIAKGATSPSILPIWKRELLNARQPPRVTFKHEEYNQVPHNKHMMNIENNKMIQRSFFSGPKQVSIIKRILPPHLRNTTTSFEAVTAFIWKYRTIAFQLNVEENVQIICVQNARDKFNPPIPIGYYGNVVAFSMVLTTTVLLCNNPLEYAIQLIKNSKSKVTEEYMKSTADLMVIKGRPNINMQGTYIVSNLMNLKADQMDFGWGKPVYVYIDEIQVANGISSFYLPFVNEKGEKGFLIPICLPNSAMERFSNYLKHFFTSSLGIKSAF